MLQTLIRAVEGVTVAPPTLVLTPSTCLMFTPYQITCSLELLFFLGLTAYNDGRLPAIQLPARRPAVCPPAGCLPTSLSSAARRLAASSLDFASLSVFELRQKTESNLYLQIIILLLDARCIGCRVPV